MIEPNANQPEEHGVVHRFLGQDAAAGGLHALLGLPPRAHDQDAVVRALERQLSRVDAHPQGRTPEADEVRLALHAAAAQLIHQAAHRERAIGKRSGAVMAKSKKHKFLQLEQDALLTLARYGGWNRRSLHRLTMLAMARGAQSSDIAKVLQHLAGRRSGGGGASASPNGQAATGSAGSLGFEPRALAIKSEGDAPEADGKPLTVVVGAIATGLTLIVAVALVIVAATSGPSESETDQPDAVEAPAAVDPSGLPMAGGEEFFPWQGTPEAAEQAAPGPTVPQFDRLSDALAALDSAADGLEIDPAEAVRVFDGAFTAVGERWCNLTRAQQRAAQHDVVEFVYRAVQRPALVDPVIDTISRRSRALAGGDTAFAAADVWPTAWSVGILARLARERDIGASASRTIEAQLRESVGSTVVVAGGFEQGVTASLWAMLSAMVDEPPEADTGERSESMPPLPDRQGSEDAEGWDRWIQAARFGSGDPEGTLLAALEWVIVSAAEPTESDATRAAIEAFTLACQWGEDAPARAWLVRMFGDRRVSVADLHEVTTTLARRSRVQGIDVTMALAVRASADARTLLRERYAAVWGISTEGPTLDDLAVDWSEAVREAALTSDPSVVDTLASVASLSRLNQAANLRFLGRLDDAGIIIDEYDRPIEMELTRWNQRQRADAIDSDPAMARWALSYLSAQRDYPRRLELLTEAARTQFRHPTDAEVLVTEAFRGSPAKAREAARAALLAQRPSAVFTLAILEIAPRMPRTPQNADLVSAMTATAPVATDDPDWKLKTRRILVQTALEQLAAEGDQGVIDRLAAVLGESYAARTMDTAASLSGDAATGTAADRAAAMLRAKWERLARGGGLGAEALEVEAVLARHAARLSLARGSIQVFAAEQVAAFELMGVVVVSEHLDRAADVQAIRARVREERRKAGDIIEQLHAVERGFCELWAVRLGQERLWDETE